MFGLQNRFFFYIFRKYNILRVYCKNVRPKYEIYEAHSRERAETERCEPRGSCNGLTSLLLSPNLYTCV